MSKQHGTALRNTPGHLANFLGAITRAAILAADTLPSELVKFWGTNQDAKLRRRLVKSLQENINPIPKLISSNYKLIFTSF
jgi:hypothetical protein